MATKKSPKEQGDLLTREKPTTRTPKQYKVVLHNDDYTPMEFVVAILQQIFRLGEVDSTRIMLQVHTTGIGVAGIYSYEIAETKVHRVLAAAGSHEYPLQCSMEPE